MTAAERRGILKRAVQATQSIAVGMEVLAACVHELAEALKEHDTVKKESTK